jgi:hypothetical protein
VSTILQIILEGLFSEISTPSGARGRDPYRGSRPSGVTGDYPNYMDPSPAKTRRFGIAEKSPYTETTSFVVEKEEIEKWRQ